MKSSEAKPLSTWELNQLHDLLQRWVLLQYPSNDDVGSSECSDAIQTYLAVRKCAENGAVPTYGYTESIKQYGELEIP